MNNTKDITVSVVAGASGFIGSHLCNQLLNERKIVVAIDNFSRGQKSYLESYFNDSHFKLLCGDLSKRDDTMCAFEEAAKQGTISEVWHLAANSDIPAGVADADVDLKDTFLTTVEILRATKLYHVKEIYFASSSAIYGDLGNVELHENIGPLLPISNYGAMKLASEALISASCESDLNKACIFRFPNVVGAPATHGVIYDFINKLIASPECLEVLGNGTQQKAYLHVSDLISAMLVVRAKQDAPKRDVINIGPIDKGVTVQWIAEQVIARINPLAQIKYSKGNKGWIGDVPKFHYSTEKLQSYGWKPQLGSSEAVRRAIDEIASQLGQ
ncbi:NAD-dependent epimerase/dehydratase family protein [Candidatus Fukatsuia endosymbiont of Drepanosiphum platanoidis]|uniref:NAD-dependent epimerase/dehydratase family protein n=1 Tax=Candidatus Fukatsuia endosymbiont of Drepanosiphum platanoidis TaxID=3077953 RepID=UPI00313D4AAA